MIWCSHIALLLESLTMVIRADFYLPSPILIKQVIVQHSNQACTGFNRLLGWKKKLKHRRSCTQLLEVQSSNEKTLSHRTESTTNFCMPFKQQGKPHWSKSRKEGSTCSKSISKVKETKAITKDWSKAENEELLHSFGEMGVWMLRLNNGISMEFLFLFFLSRVSPILDATQNNYIVY